MGVIDFIQGEMKRRRSNEWNKNLDAREDLKKEREELKLRSEVRQMRKENRNMRLAPYKEALASVKKKVKDHKGKVRARREAFNKSAWTGNNNPTPIRSVFDFKGGGGRGWPPDNNL